LFQEIYKSIHMLTSSPIQIGINARLFPNNWRPIREEIGFAARHGFQAIQVPGREKGLDEGGLGDPLATVAAALQATELVVAMEIILRIDAEGCTASGATPLDVLKANLPAITALGIRYVHWHFVPAGVVTPAELDQATLRVLEKALIPYCREGITLAEKQGFTLGFEHNEPEWLLFATPEKCHSLLEAVPGLRFVWDFNHTAPEDVPGFKALIPRMSMLHVSDTPLPETNHHLPLGLGTVDFVGHCWSLLEGSFHGPAILEIGGLPKSGGYGRDTDEALIDSARRLEKAVRAAQEL
jgi:sugar phosphate isomerase/epimerase